MNEKTFQIRDKRQKGFFMINNEYLNGYAKYLSPVITIVYLTLCRHVDSEEKCWPSIKLISEKNNISRSSVLRSIKILEKMNMIKVERDFAARGNKKQNNIYTLLDKNVWEKNPSIIEIPGFPSIIESSIPSISRELEGNPLVKGIKIAKAILPLNENLKDSQSVVINEEFSKTNGNVIAVFSAFQKSGLNPHINYGNKTQRNAAEFLVKTYGLQEIIATIEQISTIKDRFAPVITSPYELKEKLGKLKIYLENRKQMKSMKPVKFS